MNITSTLDPRLGGRIRAAIATVAAVATALQDIDWTARLPVIVVAVLGVLTHLTPLGNAATAGE